MVSEFAVLSLPWILQLDDWMCEISTYRSNSTGTIRPKYVTVAVTVVFAFVVAEMQLRCAFLVAVSVVTFGKLYFYLVRLPNKKDNTLALDVI